MVGKNNRGLQINIKSMESRLFQTLKAFKGAEGCEANLFESLRKLLKKHSSLAISLLMAVVRMSIN